MTTSSFNFQLPGYRVVEELYRDPKMVVYRAEWTDDRLGGKSRSVTIKVLSSMYPSDRDLLEFRHQYTIAKNLDLSGVVRHYNLEVYERGYALVLEDFGGISLAGRRERGSGSEERGTIIELSVVDVLDIGIQLADTLHALGQQRIVHKDIKPANILIHPVTKQVKLIDLSIASLLPRETQEIVDPNCVEGTLAYLSPEQTGRMNRGIDYRTDFYALGVTLYELLTGKLPFVTEDPIGLIHCHLAQVATPIHLINPGIPLVVSQLVAKLMAKNVEDRYQTALGIKYDLEQCLSQYQATGIVTEFQLAKRDVSDKFLIPERLYGRELEVSILLDAFKRVRTGSSELLLVTGCSGIGKTVVINEIHKPIVKQRGYFIKGKFDQFNRNIPFSAFIQAFRDLIGQLLSETDVQLASWHRQILAAVGENGQVLIETIPELAKIIGSQPPVAELLGVAAQNRFNWLFQKLIEVFTTAEHPLVLFLDDLQWADSASLQSIELLMQSKGYLLLLGAYRDNEVSPNHPLILMLAKLRQSKSVINKITLAPLTFADTNQLVADTLHCNTDSAKPLTESIDLKAHGNPLFITQFLKALHGDGEIWFNPDGYWECDIVKIQSLAITDDVVEFIAMQIQKLPLATQDVLKLAACIGDRFDLEVLSIVSEQSQLVTMAVWNGLQAGLILPTSQIYKFNQDLEDLRNLQDGVVGVDRVFELPAANSTYRFLHDRVQQAAYSLIPADERQQTHLQIGRLLLADTPPEQQSERLFEMVNHFNIATNLIQQPDERELVATLNLLAAQKARTATAYAAAVGYARLGLQLLGKLAWQHQYELALALHETLAETTFLKGDFEQVPALVDLVIERAKTPLDRVKSYETLIQLYTLQKQYQAAISQGLEILQQLGLKLAAKPNKLTLVRAVLNTKVELLGKSHEKLVNLPEIIAPEKIAPLRILNHLLMPAFLCSQDLMVVFITSGLRFTLRHGNTPWAALFYSTYGIILASLGDFNQSYHMGKLATVLNDRFDDKSVTSQVNGSVAWFCQPWQEPLRNSTPLMTECIKGCLDSGNLTALGLSYCVDIIIDLNLGVSLDKIAAKIVIAETIVSQSPDYSQQLLAISDHSVKNLQNTSTQPALLANTIAEEVALIDQLKSTQEDSALSTIYAWKTWLAYIFEDIPNALAYADAQLPYEFADSNCYSVTTLWMFDALTRLAVYPQSDRRVQKQLLDRVKSTQRKLLKCARLMPANFQHKYDLVEAEKYRVLGEFPVAIELYNRAIQGAKTHKFVQEEAIAYECTARFYLQRGDEKIAATYMQSAYYCYLRWGAKAKNIQLEQRYPQLLAPILQAQQTAFNPLVTLAKITDPTGKNWLNHRSINLDLASVIQSAQALSSTIDLEELIQQLSQIILQNSGAEACCLALSDLQNDWQIRWNRIVEQELITTQVSHNITNRSEYPANLIYWIKNTQQSVILDARQPLEVTDLYLVEHQPQSVFCLPIIKQQKVLGVLYLEHRHAPDIFTENSKQVIAFLCTQAAIALENANLYQKSQQAAEDIRLKQRDLETLLNDRQKMELTLRASEQRYQRLSDNIPGVIYQFRMAVDGKITFPYISSGSIELFELEPAAIVADSSCLMQVIHPDDFAEFEKIVAVSIQNMTFKLWEGRVILNSGTIKWIKSASRPELQADGAIVWDGVMLDVTERKQSQFDLNLTNERLELTVAELQQATRLKDEFLATMSHELRTPLNAILGMSEALQEEIFGAINARQLNAVSTIEQSGEHLLSLINDILDVSKIAAGKLELNITQVSLSELCKSSLMLVKQQAFDKQIQIDTHLPTNPEPISIDERRMRQVLINLLNNAVKFTPTGGTVTLAVRIEPIEILAQTAGYAICFIVSDTGIGIASADLTKLFQPFIQIDSSLSRKYEGTGLGLVLVKQIVELHGGDVIIDSEVGRGSCFTAIIPQTHLNLPQPIREYLQLN
jgi:predicted ATPase/signal transduction histidine kinase